VEEESTSEQNNMPSGSCGLWRAHTRGSFTPEGLQPVERDCAVLMRRRSKRVTG